MNISFARIIATYLLKYLSLPFNHGDRCGLFTGLSREHFYLNTGSDEVLAAIENPGNGGDDEHNTESGNTVVYSWSVDTLRIGPKGMGDVLMLLPVAGRSGGKRKRTVVRAT